MLDRVYGCYGSTETGGISMMYPARMSGPRNAVTLEHVAAGTKLYLLDSGLSLCRAA